MTGMDMPGATKPEAAMPGMSMSGMRGALGDYPASREASATSWKPDNERHDGLHAMAGGWMLMSHANRQLVHSEQGGPRGE